MVNRFNAAWAKYNAETDEIFARGHVEVRRMGDVIRGTELDSITAHNYRGAKEMISHLVSLGHKRIAIINGAQGEW